MANVISTVLKLDATQLKTGFKAAQDAIKQTDGLVAKARTGISSMWASFTSSPLAIAGATAAVGAFATQAVAAASNLEESINAVNVAYGNSARAVHALGEDSVESFGLSQRAFNEFATQFSGFAEQIATGSGRQIVNVVDEMTTRIADFASVFNLDVAEAARIFQSSLAGETEALRRFGGDVSAAAVTQFALRNGLVETASEMTEAIKVQARYGLLMEETAKTAGDFANTQDSLANRLKTGQANLEDFSASVGRRLVPAIADAVGTLTNMKNVLDDIQRGSPGGEQGLASGVLGAITKSPLQSGLEYTEFLTRKLDEALGDAAGEFGAFRLVLDSVIPTTEDIAAGLAADAEAAAAVDEALEKGDQSWREYVEATNQAKGAAEGAPGTFEQMRDAVESVGDAADDTADTLGDKLVEAINAVKDAVDSAFSDIRDQLDLQDLLDDITEGFGDLAEAKDALAEERALRDLQRQLLDLLESIDSIPPQKKIDFALAIQRGGVDELYRILGDLTRGVTVPVSFSSRTPAFDSANAVFSPTAPPSAPTFTQSAIPSGTIDARQITYNFPVGTTPTTQYIDGVTDARRNGTRTA